MDKKLLLQEEGATQKVKEIAVMQNPRDLKMVLGSLSWNILTLLSQKFTTTSENSKNQAT
jgi:hypothetical protein